MRYHAGMKADELRAAVARLNTTLTELGIACIPPVARSHMSEMARGKRTIGAGMAARLREAIRWMEGRKR